MPSTGAGISTLDPIPEVPKGDVDLVAPLGTVDPGEAGIRVSGNINIAALHVVNAANIQVQGESKGIPVTATVNTGALTSASSAASSATQSAQEMTRQQQASARQNLPSIISVQIRLRQRAGIWIVREGAAPAGQPPRRDGSASGTTRAASSRCWATATSRKRSGQGSRTPNGAGCREAEAGVVPVTRQSYAITTLPVHRSPPRPAGRPAGRGMGGRLRGRRVALRPGQRAPRACGGGMFLAFEGGPLHAHRYGARALVGAAVAGGLLLARAGRGAARASAHFAFDIPAQPLQAALEQYSNVTGGSVVHRAALTVGGVRPP